MTKVSKSKLIKGSLSLLFHILKKCIRFSNWNCYQDGKYNNIETFFCFSLCIS